MGQSSKKSLPRVSFKKAQPLKANMTQKAEEFSYELKIPKERVAVLIGKKGEDKRGLEKATATKIDIDSNEGEVAISGKDALKLYSCREVIRAIARGFNPETAQILLKQDYGLEVMPLGDRAKTKDALERLKGRVIGEGGKARRVIEDLTDTHISVYGKTISIIGDYEGLVSARRAVESLLSGSPHAHVYRWLEQRRRELKRREFIGPEEYLKKAE
jgi:ribosomal RNA assembly protein